jgi:hypothetical protein
LICESFPIPPYFVDAHPIRQGEIVRRETALIDQEMAESFYRRGLAAVVCTHEKRGLRSEVDPN